MLIMHIVPVRTLYTCTKQNQSAYSQINLKSADSAELSYIVVVRLHGGVLAWVVLGQ